MTRGNMSIGTMIYDSPRVCQVLGSLLLCLSFQPLNKPPTPPISIHPLFTPPPRPYQTPTYTYLHVRTLKTNTQ